MAHSSVAYQPDDDDEDEVVAIPAGQAYTPRLLPVPSAWWDTPAVVSCRLQPAPEEARAARQFARGLLADWGLGHLTDDAEMIVAELVVNAVRHGLRNAPVATPSPLLRLCLLHRAGEVMLAVTDPSSEPPQSRNPGWTGESGRGLQIVGALSYLWGWSPIEGRGKAVWAVLRYR
ncbi:MAG: ATP-binding protein [Nocardiopsaceae bacterium]|nr:ATP-binding protein [Nocardiopsaceae bacterium]